MRLINGNFQASSYGALLYSMRCTCAGRVGLTNPERMPWKLNALDSIYLAI